MKNSLSIASALVASMMLAPAAMAETTTFAEESAVKKEKPKKITDRSHPDYVRCRSEPIIGSLARKRRVCMKNKEWAAHNREGGRRSREFVEDMQVGQNASN